MMTRVPFLTFFLVVCGISNAADRTPFDRMDVFELMGFRPPDTSALSSFFDSLSNFLSPVGDGFSAGSASGSSSSHYSESLAVATSLIDGISELDGPSLAS